MNAPRSPQAAQAIDRLGRDAPPPFAVNVGGRQTAAVITGVTGVHVGGRQTAHVALG